MSTHNTATVALALLRRFDELEELGTFTNLSTDDSTGNVYWRDSQELLCNLKLLAEEAAHKPQLDSDSPVASCECLTKTPEVAFHRRGCKYRLIMERDEALRQERVLKTHAELTIKELEKRLKNRGYTTGIKLWETRLLRSAYAVLSRPVPPDSAIYVEDDEED